MNEAEYQMKQFSGALGAAGAAVGAAGGPLGVVGRAIGLGQDEIQVGIPKWAWLGIGIVAGGLAAYLLRDRLEALVEGRTYED